MVLVVYDVTDDGKRLKISECCQDFGLERLQYSMFGGAINATHRKDLIKRLKMLLGKAEGRLIILNVAANDWDERVEWINAPKDGKTKPAFGRGGYVLTLAKPTHDPNEDAI
jgi:CRISPR-associated protein Cas2